MTHYYLITSRYIFGMCLNINIFENTTFNTLYIFFNLMSIIIINVNAERE